MSDTLSDGTAGGSLLAQGGPVLWILVVLSVLTLALILWKAWRLAALGVWRRERARRAATLWADGRGTEALAEARAGEGAVSAVVAAAISAQAMPRDAGREETARVAMVKLAELRFGLRALETVVTIAPLLGLFGTVLGMIEVFQALQGAGGGRADPSVLAGGIWEALLTTAAGMAIAIPAGVALNAFEAAIDGARLSMEDFSARIFALGQGEMLPLAAE